MCKLEVGGWICFQMLTIENNECGWAKGGDWEGPQEEGKMCISLQFAQTSGNGEREGKKATEGGLKHNLS